MTMGYCISTLALQLEFWLVPNIVSSAVSISFMGFFFGPMFATGMSIATKIFPTHIQPTALGECYYHVLLVINGSNSIRICLRSRPSWRALFPALLQA
jgi:hypothetical protein